ncbi:MAG: hypothetical protein ACI8V4_000205, partial [Ilumatobacter sp.]
MQTRRTDGETNPIPTREAFPNQRNPFPATSKQGPLAGLTRFRARPTEAGMVRNVARNSTHVLFASVANASGTRSRAELPISG